MIAEIINLIIVFSIIPLIRDLIKIELPLSLKSPLKNYNETTGKYEVKLIFR
jgi:hypothetical protein